MRRLLPSLSVLLFVGVLGIPVTARAQQSLSLNLGGFVPSGEDNRVNGDVLFNDQNFFLFRFDSFRAPTIGADWLIALTKQAEVGLGVGLYSRTVPSAYSNFQEEGTGAAIRQNLKLRTVPFTATFRLLPFGRDAAIQPYVGGGVGVVSWRYSETGDFVDFNNAVFHDRFVGSGTATGPVVLGGVRIPAGLVDVGFEIRHQSGEGKLDSGDFAGATKIDLGGFSYLATFNIKF